MKKYKKGGPLDPIIDLIVDPTIAKLFTPVPIDTFPAMQPRNIEYLNSKTKSKDRWREKSLGGSLLSAGVSMIPGVGQVLSPIVSIVDQQIAKDKLEKEQQILNTPLMQMNNNPLGNFAKGGILNDQFKQYSTGSHSSGNDLLVDSEGNPDPNGQSSVQNKENSYQVGNKQYVFSDALKFKGKPFNIHAMEINKKYPKARFEVDQRNALDLEMKMLAKSNDIERMKSEQLNVPKQFALGGFPDFYAQGLQDPNDEFDTGQIPLREQAGTNAYKFNFGQLPVQDPNIALDNTSVISNQPINLGTNLTPTTPINTTGAGTVSNPVVQPRTSNPGSVANGIGLGLKGLALAGSVIDAVNPAEKEQLIQPQYNQSDNDLRAANINYSQAKQDAVGVSNIGRNLNRSSVSNFASYQGREMSRLGQLSDQLGRISEAENNAQSAINMQRGQIENQRAQDLGNRRYQNRVDNLQNSATARGFDRVLQSDLSQIGSSFNQYAETQKLNQNQKELNQFATSQTLAILGSKYPNFKLNPDLVEQFKAGKITMDDFLQYVPDEVKTEVKASVKTKTNG